MQVLVKRVFVLNYRFKLPKVPIGAALWWLFFGGPRMRRMVEPGVYEEFNPREEVLKYRF